jgi:hypothetical protein
MSSQDEPDPRSENPLLDLAPDRQEDLINAVLDADEDEEDTSRTKELMSAATGSKSSRRDVLGALLGGGIVGAGAYGASTGSARAASNEVGQVGEAGSPVDIVAEDVYGPGGQGSNDAVNFEAIGAGSLNNIQWLSNNDSSLSSVKTGLQGAANGDVLAIAPGSHDTPGEIDITADVTILWLGELVLSDSTATEVVDAEQQIHIISNGIVQGGNTAITSSVSDSAVGMRVHKQSSTAGSFVVTGMGSHGVFFEQRESDDNTNGSDMAIVANNNGGDGVRIENTSGNAVNLNAMYLRFPTLFSNSGHGLNAVSGFDNVIEAVNVEANSKYGVRHAVGDRNHYRLTHAESNTNGSIVLDGDFAIVDAVGDISVTDNVTGSNHLIKQFGNMTSSRIKGGSTGVLDGEILIDSTNGRLVFADRSGNRWYISGTAF